MAAPNVTSEQAKALLCAYGDAIRQSRSVGRPVSFRVDVGPEGETVITPAEDAAPLREPDLDAALAAARERGRLRAEEILSGGDMLNVEAFAKFIATTPVTVNAKRRTGQILGLEGASRGFRFPVWQVNEEGKPWAELAALHERLGGLTGREALARGRAHAVLAAAESIGREFR